MRSNNTNDRTLPHFNDDDDDNVELGFRNTVLDEEAMRIPSDSVVNETMSAAPAALSWSALTPRESEPDLNFMLDPQDRENFENFENFENASSLYSALKNDEPLDERVLTEGKVVNCMARALLNVEVKRDLILRISSNNKRYADLLMPLCVRFSDRRWSNLVLECSNFLPGQFLQVMLLLETNSYKLACNIITMPINKFCHAAKDLATIFSMHLCSSPESISIEHLKTLVSFLKASHNTLCSSSFISELSQLLTSECAKNKDDKISDTGLYALSYILFSKKTEICKTLKNFDKLYLLSLNAVITRVLLSCFLSSIESGCKKKMPPSSEEIKSCYTQYTAYEAMIHGNTIKDLSIESMVKNITPLLSMEELVRLNNLKKDNYAEGNAVKFWIENANEVSAQLPQRQQLLTLVQTQLKQSQNQDNDACAAAFIALLSTLITAGQTVEAVTLVNCWKRAGNFSQLAFREKELRNIQPCNEEMLQKADFELCCLSRLFNTMNKNFIEGLAKKISDICSAPQDRYASAA